MKKDILIIGGGAAGLAAALGAYDPKLEILIIERSHQLGGILNQCIHHGFGLTVFQEELTGPEFAYRLIKDIHDKNIPYFLETTVIDIKKHDEFIVTLSSEKEGLYEIHAQSVIMTTGCYERTRGAIDLPGDRPKGIMTAGCAQRYMNMDGYLVGKNVFILGSGDIGLIMARRMTLEGAKVHGVAEIMPYSNGLNRNIAQCLDDFNIPLFLSHTVTNIEGKDVLKRVTISEVDQYYQPIQGTEKRFEVDTLLLSVGLIPDIKLFHQLTYDVDFITKSAFVNQYCETSLKNLYICGNALHVHDLVDWVVLESKMCGKYAKENILTPIKENIHPIDVQPMHLVRYVVPQRINIHEKLEDIELKFRVTQKIEKGVIEVKQNQFILASKKIRHLVPAEMAHIMIPHEAISLNGAIEITITEVLS